MVNTDLLLTQAEAAAVLRVHRTTIWRLVRDGHLDRVSVGRRSLITRASIERFVNQQLTQPPADRWPAEVRLPHRSGEA
jgi:excisionase family DNA binding protein